MSDTATLLIHCPDKKGIVAEVTRFLLSYDANIVEIEQHVDTDWEHFFMRVEWQLIDFEIPKPEIGKQFDAVIAKRYHMEWSLHFSDDVPCMAIFVTKLTHCLYDILQRVESGEWNVKIPLIISNHERLRPIAEKHNIPYHVFPITKETKAAQEKKQKELLEQHNVDVIVLARYMQILSDDFVSDYPDQIINIHHSFLPAFVGAKPYHQAHARGVKIIGATSHFVTAELDAGPIIAQDVNHISHRDQISDLVRKGKDLEKMVLSRALWLKINHRILSYRNKTVLF
ncbi:MAG: formyltetrahydrofolate deformylase [Saprospiraceae bacterium]|nr:formyltetrahydrofolate deformylase [Saprospiraceae bacterium]